jgi:hypothetical protein
VSAVSASHQITRDAKDSRRNKESQQEKSIETWQTQKKGMTV